MQEVSKTVKSGHMASAKINHTATNLSRKRVSRRDQRGTIGLDRCGVEQYESVARHRKQRKYDPIADIQQPVERLRYVATKVVRAESQRSHQPKRYGERARK